MNMKKASWALVLGCLFTAPLTAVAQEPAPAAATEDFGADTRAWLNLQASNNATMGGSRPMPGEIADQVFARYAKSFTHPIPEYFEREKFVEGGGSSQ